MLRLEDKKAIVTEVSEIASTALSAAVADYRGLTVTQMNELRAQARENKVYLKVVKNTLAKRAIEGTEFACMGETLKGPMVLAFSLEEPGASARLIREFVKKNKELEVKGLAMGGELFGEEKLETFAKLPTREEALASLCRVMMAPVTQFVRTLNEPTAQMVRVMAQVGDKKQAA
ncbi:50S ribosomal protein L10 [Thiotrichales bacterium 19S11-10]|nr:50S ribosomal protein L10 [Thiotrichales bacterium 19S11-10]MCF6807047.1 50S ribosomal protein L10 [Thiotrichales bacterium 19S9-11]MCF6811016.1 50S ribosomal protein L10 [Thiotrichales bacterium 19S9-12]